MFSSPVSRQRFNLAKKQLGGVALSWLAPSAQWCKIPPVPEVSGTLNALHRPLHSQYEHSLDTPRRLLRPRIMLRWLLDWIWGYDFFVSYAHADGYLIEQGRRRSQYVRLLVEKLRDLKFSVCHDETDYGPGDELDAATLRSVRASTKLLVIARPAAMTSDWVLKEVIVALDARNDVAVIDINRTFQKSPVDNPVRLAIGDARLRFDEVLTNSDGEPSGTLIDKLSAASQRSRRDRRRLRVIQGAAVFFGLLAAVATGFGFYANAQRRLAERRRIQSLGVVETMLIDVDRSLETVPEAMPVRQRLLSRVGELLETLETSDDLSSLRLKMIELGSLAEQSYTHRDMAAARRERERALAIAEDLLRRNNPGAEYDVFVSCVRLVQVLFDIGDLNSAEQVLERALGTVRQNSDPDPARDEYSRSLASVLDRLGDLQLRKGHLAAAITYYRKALEASRTVLALDENPFRDMRDHVATVGHLVTALISANDLTDARPLADEAVQMSRDILKKFPNNPDALAGLASSLNNRAEIHYVVGEHRQAKQSFVEMENALRSILVRDSSNHEFLRNLAVALRGRSKGEKALGNLKAAQDLTDEGLGLRGQLASFDRSNTLHQWDLAVDLQEAGDLHSESGDLSKSEAAYNQAVAVLKAIVSGDGAANAHYQASLASNLMRLGFSRLAQRKDNGVRDLYEEALRIQRSLVKADPSDVMHRRSVSLTLEAQADLALRQRRFKDAQSLGEEAVEIRRAVADKEPATVGFTKDLSRLSTQQRRTGEVMMRRIGQGEIDSSTKQSSVCRDTKTRDD
jgi:tetratricopeptide (TPR) repeat protein